MQREIQQNQIKQNFGTVCHTDHNWICNQLSRKGWKSGSRNLVLEIWFEKSGWRNLDGEKWLTRKKVVLYYKSTFFQVGEKWFCKLGFFFLVWEKWLTRKKIWVWRTTFLEKWWQIKWLNGILFPKLLWPTYCTVEKFTTYLLVVMITTKR